MEHIEQSIVVAEGPDVLFALLSDPLRFPEYFSAFPRVELVSDRGQCLGARYLMLMKVGHIEAGGVQRITELRPPHRIAFESEVGIAVSGSVSLTPLDARRTEVRFALEYKVPGSRVPALIVERLTRHMVTRNLQATLLSLKRMAEFDLPESFGTGPLPR